MEISILNKTTIFQLFRYGIVGVVINALGYGIYLLITSMGMSPKMCVSILYPVGVSIGFLGHGKWTFGAGSAKLNSFPKFILVHLLGYITNLLLLFYFVDVVGYPHQFVQLGAILVVALQLFVAFKLFVFTDNTSS